MDKPELRRFVHLLERPENLPGLVASYHYCLLDAGMEHVHEHVHHGRNAIDEMMELQVVHCSILFPENQVIDEKVPCLALIRNLLTDMIIRRRIVIIAASDDCPGDRPIPDLPAPAALQLRHLLR